jgi:hypothetical protein
VLSFCCFDEEPVLDLTDLNVLHVWVFAMSLAIILFEPTLRARSGQLVYKDVVTLAAVLTFWLHLENYCRLIIVVCALHNLMPYEVDLLEQSEVFLLYSTWLATDLLPGFLTLGVLLGLGMLINASLGVKQRALTGLLVTLVCLGHLVVGTFLAWDLLLSSLTSVLEWERGEVFYLQPRTGWTYDRAMRVGDQFEWHRERCHPYSLRFEDLYFFFLQLLVLWDLICSLICWLYLLASCFSGHGVGVSYLQVGLGILWLEQVCLAVFFVCVAVGAPTVRLLSRAPGELGCWWW